MNPTTHFNRIIHEPIPMPKKERIIVLTSHSEILPKMQYVLFLKLLDFSIIMVIAISARKEAMNKMQKLKKIIIS